MPTIGRVQRVGQARSGRRKAENPGMEAMESCVAEGEDATVRHNQPIAVLVRRGCDVRPPGAAGCRLPVDPWKPAEPKVKMPPSEPTRQ